MDISAKISIPETSLRAGIIPPGPRKGIFGLNILVPYYKSYLKFLAKLHKNYGDVVYFKAGSEKIYLINDPEFIEHIFITNPNNYLRGTGFSRLRMLLGEGLLSTDGSMHKRHRSMMQPSFHKKSIEDYTRVMSSCVEENISKWNDKNTIDIQNESVDLFLKIITRLLFGEKNEDEFIKLGKFFDSLTYDYKAFILIGLPGFARKLPFRWAKDFYTLNHKLDDFIYSAIDTARKSDQRNDILSLLINAKDDSGNGLSDKEIRDELATLYFAAYDTSARTLTWALYLLSMNKNILDRFLSLNDDPEAFNEYANMIISETLRIYPPAHSITRLTDKDDYIKQTAITAGSSIIICPFLIHRDERCFNNAFKFIPERWSKHNKKDISRMTYLPFGAGKRSCIGEAFARMQVSIALQQICSGFDFTITGNANVSAHLTLKPAGKLTMSLKTRAGKAGRAL